jgi:hypothetical protein
LLGYEDKACVGVGIEVCVGCTREKQGLGWRLRKNNRKRLDLQLGPFIAPLALHVSLPYSLLLLCALCVAPSFSSHCSSMLLTLFVQLLCVTCLYFSFFPLWCSSYVVHSCYLCYSSTLFALLFQTFGGWCIFQLNFVIWNVKIYNKYYVYAYFSYWNSKFVFYKKLIS